MRKLWIILFCGLFAFSSCGSYEAAGAYTGAQFGSMVGSVIGGVSGGWRGHDLGSVIGMAGGAAVGAAIGKAADRKAEQRAEEVYARRMGTTRSNVGENESGFDPSGNGDDRIRFDGAPPIAASPVSSNTLEIRNMKVLDDSHDGRLTRGESARVVFEIYNTSSKPVYDVLPSVTEQTGNKHIHISENVLVENIQAKQAIRYTAQIKADQRLKDGEVVLRIGVLQSGQPVALQMREYRMETSRR